MSASHLTCDALVKQTCLLLNTPFINSVTSQGYEAIHILVCLTQKPKLQKIQLCPITRHDEHVWKESPELTLVRD